MTPHPVTVEPEETISDALELMKHHHIHRIPVVDSRDCLRGLITEGMIAGADRTPTSLSIYELNYLLAKTKVKSVMERHPFAIQEDALMEEATALLLKEDIGCLPVLNKEGKVVGILTQNDVFRAFLELLGWDHGGSRLILSLEDRVGVLEKLSDFLASHSINIRNISVIDVDNGISKVIIKTEPALDPEFVVQMKDAGYDILEFENFESLS